MRIGYIIVHRGALAWTTNNGPKDTIYETREAAQRDACPLCTIAEVWL